eukprot:COSAG05_NODE_24588_length_244_cov_1434.827586_1_plen_48_part_01
MEGGVPRVCNSGLLWYVMNGWMEEREEAWCERRNSKEGCMALTCNPCV